jgi:hypothetical protein
MEALAFLWGGCLYLVCRTSKILTSSFMIHWTNMSCFFVGLGGLQLLGI